MIKFPNINYKSSSLAIIASLMAFSSVGVYSAQAEEYGSVTPIEVKKELADLGKRLFYDIRLSGGADLACASCHQPDKAFTDGEALSDAYADTEHFRNTPTLANVGHKASWFHDGRIGTNLNDVTRESITETYFMNMDMRIMQERLKQDPIYVDLFDKAGKGEPSNGGARSAIQEFLKSITSSGAPFDSGNMSDSAKAGFDLFTGKAGCVACHSGNLFSDDKPHNTGVADNPDIWSNPDRHVTFVTFGKFQGIENYMNLRMDPGAYIRNRNKENMGTFMTPTLRELTYTAPYMHNGTIATLEEVVDFYNEGGGEATNIDPLLKPLDLSDGEKADLVEFLKSLSGNSFDVPAYNPGEFDTEYTVITDWLNKKN
ncbi:MAG: photosynthetic protein synthase I [Devosiaceae bacterium]|nr:photosynthetic protein synthase I [Devosiaceae bacterium]